MEQWFAIGRTVIDNVEFTSGGSFYYSTTQTITFPAEFSANPSTSVSVRTANLCWAGNIASDTKKCTYQAFHSTDVRRTVAVEWQAVGRWK